LKKILDSVVRLVRAFIIVYRLGPKNIIDLSEKALSDPLTGVYNRWPLEDLCKREINRAERDHSPFSIVVIDIDGLWEINDTHGHSKGDKVLQELAAVLKSICRKGDYVFRLGGDEFLLLLPNIGEETALKVVDRIKMSCRKEGSLLEVSCGIASWQDGSLNHDSIINDLIEEADASMYKEKKAKGILRKK